MLFCLGVWVQYLRSGCLVRTQGCGYAGFRFQFCGSGLGGSWSTRESTAWVHKSHPASRKLNHLNRFGGLFQACALMVGLGVWGLRGFRRL